MVDSAFQDISMFHCMLRSVLHQIWDSHYPCYTELWIQAGANVDSCIPNSRLKDEFILFFLLIQSDLGLALYCDTKWLSALLHFFLYCPPIRALEIWIHVMPEFGLQYSIPSSHGVLKYGVQDRFVLYTILSSKFSVGSILGLGR
jgi:hypothetical protein